MRVGIVGGGFDPIHYGHLLMGDAAIESKKVDVAWFMPCWGHTFGKDLTAANHRLAMTELAVKGFDRCYACPFEIENECTGSTYNTLCRLQDAFKGTGVELHYIIGSDNAQKIDQWVNWKKLIEEFKFIITERPGVQLPEWTKFHQVLPHATESQTVNGEGISSAMIRNWIKNGQDDLAVKYMPLQVFKYIKGQKLYV